jgi:vacuolar-type H+-ATPase subunit E/Vma4
MMVKVNRPELGAHSNEAARAQRPRALTLSMAEMSALRRVLEARKQAVMDTIDRADELKLHNLLDDLDCDKSTSDAIQVR